MFFRKIHFGISILALTLIVISCPAGNELTVKPAAVTFWNLSTHKVDIYKNLNPQHFDPTTLVCTLDSGEQKTIEQYPSYDQVIGDAFYPRYKIILDNSIKTGTTDIYVDAERTLSNRSSFVIKSGERYTETIVNPGSGELRVVNSYIIVKNQENVNIQIIRGDTILPKMDNKAVLLNAYSTGYYEVGFSFFDTSITMNQMKAFTSQNIPFPSFIMERGKKYTFTLQDGLITGPVIENIL